MESELELVEKGILEPEPVKKEPAPQHCLQPFAGDHSQFFLLTKLFTYSKMNRSRTNSLKKKISSSSPRFDPRTK